MAAVPGRPGDEQSKGALALLRRPGTVLARNAADVLEVAGQLGLDAVVETRGPQTPLDALDELTRAVAEAVPVRSGADAASISRVAGLSLLSVQAALTRLDLAGLVEHRAGRWRPRGPAARRPPTLFSVTTWLARHVGATHARSAAGA